MSNHGKSVGADDIDEASLVQGAGEINKQVLKPIRRRSTISNIRKGSMVKPTAQELKDSCEEAASFKEQMYDVAKSQYNRYKSLMASLAPDELQSLRAQAAK